MALPPLIELNTRYTMKQRLDMQSELFIRLTMQLDGPFSFSVLVPTPALVPADIRLTEVRYGQHHADAVSGFRLLFVTKSAAIRDHFVCKNKEIITVLFF